MKYFFYILWPIVFNNMTFGYDSFAEMASAMANKFDAPTVSVDELEHLISQKKILLLDVRESVEFSVSHIQGALNIGYDDFEIDKLPPIISKNSKIIVYCSVGYRSGDIAAKLKAKGFDAYNLHGGLFAWNNSGRALYSKEGKVTDNIHGYNKSWAKWLTRGKISY